jgi:hypothetical protein
MIVRFREGSQEVLTLDLPCTPAVGWILRIEGDPFAVIAIELRVASGEWTVIASVSRIVVPKSTR